MYIFRHDCSWKFAKSHLFVGITKPICICKTKANTLIGINNAIKKETGIECYFLNKKDFENVVCGFVYGRRIIFSNDGFALWDSNIELEGSD